ncbi:MULTISPECIES: signal peptidase I [Streptomyces]|uniref:signal peptidase I n=1 Tax=Streptomyces TaxID=1883 RepID=UPI0016513EF7|nr:MULTISPECIES: signal peptidase I [Streptomyces]
MLTAGLLMAGGGALAPRLLYRAVSYSASAMEPTYAKGDLLLFRKDPAEVRRGDVVLVTVGPMDGGEGPGGPVVERVVAVGGDTIAYEPGASRLTLGGRPLDEPYVKDGAPTAGSAGPFSVSVPQGRVFLLGDNRGNSADSRYRMRTTPGGTAPVAHVLGVALSDEETRRTAVLFGSLIIVGLLALLAFAVLGVLWLVARRRRPAVQGPVWGATTVEPAGPRHP